MLGAPSEDTSSSKPKTSMLRSRWLLGSRRLVLAARSRFAQPRSTGRPLRHSFFCVDRPARCLARHPPECPCQVTSCTPSRTNAAPHLTNAATVEQWLWHLPTRPLLRPRLWHQEWDVSA